MAKAKVLYLSPRPESLAIAEQAVVASILFDPKVLPDVERVLTGREFYSPAISAIYQAMLALSAESRPIDLVSVTEELAKQKTLDAAGGPGFLASLQDNIGSASQAEYYAKVVREAAAAREYAAYVKRWGQESEQAAAGKYRLHDVLEKHESELFALSRQYFQSTAMSEIGAIVQAELDHLEKIQAGQIIEGVQTGLAAIDALTTGLRPAELIYLAARPGVGKSALALQIANNCGVPVGFFSLEMSNSQLAKRQLSLISGIDGYKIKIGRLSREEWATAALAAGKMADLPIYVDDKPAQTIQEIRSKCRWLVARYSVKLVIVDYLQLIKAPRCRSREEEVSVLSANLKAMAKELDIPVLCLAQLNRRVDERPGGKPILSDLRESGSLEQDADMVLFFWRDKNQENLLHFHLAKNRNGATGEGNLITDFKTQRIYDDEHDQIF